MEGVSLLEILIWVSLLEILIWASPNKSGILIPFWAKFVGDFNMGNIICANIS
jgi:hypothetical protein